MTTAERRAGDAGGGGRTLQESLARRPRRRRGPVDDHILDDRAALFRELESSRRFHRDRVIGRVFHPGAVSFRENVRNNSLHIIIEGNRVSAHVDRVSPLDPRPERRSRYALGRVALHNLSGMAADLVRVVRGRQGDHRCELDCEWAPAHGPSDGPEAPMLDPEDSPWSVHAEARVAGVLDDERMAGALAAVTGDGGVLSVVHCADAAAVDAAREQLQALAVPLAPPPLRVVLAHGPGGDVVMANVNHAAADGPGALQVLEAVAGAYAGRPGTPALDFLATHDVPVRPSVTHPKALAYRYRTRLERVRDALARPVLPCPDGSSGATGHGCLRVAVEAPDAASLATLGDRDRDNDVLVAALHRAVAVWNADHGRSGGRICVLVPVDLRTRPWPPEVVGNLSVTARIATDPGDRATPTEALRAVVAQTTRNIRTRTGTALIDALDRHGLLPLWARQSVIVLQPLTANRRLDSAVLAYVGRLDDPPSFGPGAGETTEVWVSAPARTPHGLSVGGAVVDGRLHLMFRYPRRLFDEAAARRFAQAYVAQLRLVATAPLPRD
ncbi:MAG: hypothetical protein ACLGIO_08440 [Acidimicrobiia bacterium]